jgi:hypothetical protein
MTAKDALQKAEDSEQTLQVEPAAGRETVQDPAGAAMGIHPMLPATGGAVDGQASLLTDSNLSPGHRRNLATGIGRLQGNRHLQRVMRVIQRRAATVQREDGEEEETAEAGTAEPAAPAAAPSLSLGTGGFGSRPSLLPELQLDPGIQAQMRAIQFMMEQLDPVRIRPRLLELDPGSITTPSPALTPTAPATETPLVPAGAGPSRPREASGSDVVEAVMGLPVIEQALTTLQTRAVDQLRHDWGRLSTGERVAAVTAAVLVGGGALAGAMTNPEGREFVLGQLNGRVLPVPGVTGLSVELNTAGENLMVGLHLDVGSLLPEWMGFGPSSPSAIGAPPSP